jgi:DNA topoisomerase-1
MARKTNKKPPTGKGANKLIVVESPAKARTIGRILGKEYRITASMGHVRDLPKGKLGIDVEHQFTPTYAIMKSKAATVKEIRELGKEATSIYLATDPDREGEAISWHLANALGWDPNSTDLQRIVFHEITKDAIQEAFKHTRPLDIDLVNAQQARRILDRLVGYELSPLLWKKVQKGLSAGRVQSVTLRQVVDREMEIQAFVPKEYWTLEANLAKDTHSFTAVLHSVEGDKKKIQLPNEARVKEIEKDLKGANYLVASVKTKEKRRRPSPPFTTSTLQQEASRKLRFSAKRTMAVAQQLYEGIALGSEGSAGLITYMRTDSTSLASVAVAEARQHIKEHFGPEYLPKTSRVYKTKSKGAQEAHEAIRPTSIHRTPKSLEGRLNQSQMRLYNLIWRRTLACQMADAIYDATSVDIKAPSTASDKSYIFRVTGTRSKFLGFITLYLEGRDDDTKEESDPLPHLTAGDLLNFLKLKSNQHFTQPPARYTEATLVKLLEEKGIGRPSTYAPILSTLVDRNYVLKEQNKLKPTALGTQVSTLLAEFFPDVMDVAFTAKMEDSLDQIARGEQPWVPMLERFYFPFKKTLDEAQVKMPRVKVEEPTDEVCDKCSSPMVIKTGRFGRFLACSTFPECRNTGQLGSNNAKAADEPTDEICDKCGNAMVIKTGRFGKFISCSTYPKCRNTKPMKTGVPCPRCGGDLVERRSKGKGRIFYGCANYPTCDFLVSQRPLPEPCPECGGLMVSRRRDLQACTVCAWKGEPSEKTEVAAEV